MNVRPYPFERLPRMTRADAASESALAGWLAARPSRNGLAALAQGLVTITAVRVAHEAGPALSGGGERRDPDATVAIRGERLGAFAQIDRDAATCIVRIAGATIEVRGSSRAVRRLAQKLLGGPAELDAPRPLTQIEQDLWAHIVATAVDDLAIAGEVLPLASAQNTAAARATLSTITIDCVLGDIPLVVEVRSDAALRPPPPRPVPAWAARATIDVPVVLGRCALSADAVGQLAIRDIVTLERPAGAGRRTTAGAIAAELEILGGVVGVQAAAGAVSAETCTGYVRRDMSLPDEAHVELTVALGTTAMSLRQVLDLAVGQIVSLGRPLAGPFELRAAGRVIGRGELVDVDGELGVRIVSLEDS